MSDSVDKENVMNRKNITSLAAVVVFGILVQAGFAAWDCKSTPADTAVSFARAYYGLNPSMAKWMCNTPSAPCGESGCDSESAPCPKNCCDKDSANCPKTDCDKKPTKCAKADCGTAPVKCVNSVVEEYLYNAGADAAERGFNKNFAKYALSHIETRTEYLDDTTAMVHLTAHRRVSINPFYAYVAQLFRIGDTHEVDRNIRVVKLEDGRWRVCKSSL